MTTNWTGAGQVTCPHCHAQPGQPCVDEYGRALTWAPAHPSRAFAASRSFGTSSRSGIAADVEMPIIRTGNVNVVDIEED